MPRSQSLKTITIQDVARLAKVSAMTVSNVCNARGRVSDETRNRILRVIKETGYVPNQAARRLAGIDVARVGLLFAAADSLFMNTAVGAISIAASTRGLQMIVQEATELSHDRVLCHVESLIRAGAEGLVLVPPFVELLAESPRFRRLGVPAVALATASPLVSIATVRIDNRGAMMQLTTSLIQSGRKRIALVSGPLQHSDSVPRLDGYKAALQAAGLSFDPDLVVQGDYMMPSGLRAAERLLSLKERPDAIMATSDDMAAGVITAAHRAGLEIPRDLAITGFDDTAIATRVWPALTTIRQPLFEMAEKAIDLLSSTMAPDGGGRSRDVVLDFSLMIRDSA